MADQAKRVVKSSASENPGAIFISASAQPALICQEKGFTKVGRGRILTETQLKQKIYKVLDKDFPGHYRRKFAGQFVSGCLDLVIIYRGKTVWIELKCAPREKTPLQDREMKKINFAGNLACCITACKNSIVLDTYWKDGEVIEYSNLTDLLKGVLL